MVDVLVPGLLGRSERAMLVHVERRCMLRASAAGA